MRKLASVLPIQFALFSSLLLLFFVAVPPATMAAAASGTNEQVRIVGHLPLNGMHVNQMFVQQRDHKSYLYLHRSRTNAYALVDVTRPSKPVLVSRRDLAEPTRTQVDPPASGSVLAIAVRPEGAVHTAAETSTAAMPSTQTVQLLDLSDPKNPKMLKTFQGVTSLFPDDARKLVFLTNAEGLWIISHHAIRPMPICSSSDALNPLPDCQ